MSRPPSIMKQAAALAEFAAQDVATIPLSKGKVAIVDAADHDWLSQWKWKANVVRGQWRAVRTPSGSTNSTIYMHRAIMAAPASKFVDHINHDALDNRRSNLRLATPQQNQCNRKSQVGATSKFLGVHIHSQSGKWTAQVTLNGKRKHLGLFDCEEDAARAYDAAARLAHGQFANLNFSLEQAA